MNIDYYQKIQRVPALYIIKNILEALKLSFQLAFGQTHRCFYFLGNIPRVISQIKYNVRLIFNKLRQFQN